VYQLSVYVHILGAVIWVGGMLFLALVVVPVSRRLPSAERGAFIGAIGRRFRAVGWACIALLVVTGAMSSGYRGVTWESIASGRLFGSAFGRILATKLALVAAMLVLSAIHDFAVGPASARALERPGTPPRQVASLRRAASWMARVNALLALLVIALAVALVRGLPG
jgi:putative copper resistance protein D